MYHEDVSDSKYSDPRVALNRIYTKRGDTGETSLAGGQRVPKDAARIEAYGTVDELSAFVGLACVTCEENVARSVDLARLAKILRRVQHELFNLGSILSTLPADVHPKQARVTEAEVEQLEREMDEMNAELPPLRSFVLPGGTEAAAKIHVARAVCRRAEIAALEADPVNPLALAYLNRLSDLLFILARAANAGRPEPLWKPGSSR